MVRFVPRFAAPCFLLFVAAFAGAMFAGCKGESAATPRRASKTLEAMAPRWAKGFEWSRYQGPQSDPKEKPSLRIRVLNVTRPWKDARDSLRYTLVPADPTYSFTRSRWQVVRVPARRIVCLAATHVGFLRALDATDLVIGVDAGNHIYDSTVRQGLAAGTVFEAGSGAQLNIERLLAEKPDLVIANAVGLAENEALDRLRRAGIPVLVTGEWMENQPLARAEWLRVFGALTGKEALADSLFGAIEKDYLALADSARALPSKPTAMIGAPFRDQWFVSGGRSYMARFLEDAGADYPWKNDTTAGGVALSFETVLVQAGGADVWLYPEDWSRPWKTLADGLRQDARYAAFKPVREARVYNNDARRLADGANDYWESGIVNPHLMLSDLVSIFHGGGPLHYHRRLPRGS